MTDAASATPSVAARRRMAGHCHCGAICAELVSAKAPSELQVRSCQCSFCTRHGAMTVGDPGGHARLIIDPAALVSYAFATRSGRILVCGRCGVYAGVVLEEEGGVWSVLNVRGLAIPEFAGRTGEPVDYDGETAERELISMLRQEADLVVALLTTRGVIDAASAE